MADEREFEPDGFFGKRGISRGVADAREYVRFERISGENGKLDAAPMLDRVFRADRNLREHEGFIEWLVRQSGGGYVMQKHSVPLPGLDPSARRSIRMTDPSPFPSFGSSPTHADPAPTATPRLYVSRGTGISAVIRGSPTGGAIGLGSPEAGSNGDTERVGSTARLPHATPSRSTKASITWPLR